MPTGAPGPACRLGCSAGGSGDSAVAGCCRSFKIGRADCPSCGERFVHEELDALAGLKPRLLSDVEKLPGARILDGRFTAVQQAVGTARKKNTAGAAFLRGFVEEAKATGLVARLIERHDVRGLSVAAPA